MASATTVFGVGTLYLKLAYDQNGIASKVDTSIPVGILQNVELSFTTEIKELHGNQTYPADVGTGKTSSSLKTKYASLDAQSIAYALRQNNPTNGAVTMVTDPLGVLIPAAAPFTQTFTLTTGTTWANNGVIFADDTTFGVPLIRVQAPTVPTTGQYTAVQAGQTVTYTFAAADFGDKVIKSYFLSNALSGQTVSIQNTIMGLQPTFELFLQLPQRRGVAIGVRFFNVVGAGISMPLTNDDFSILDTELKYFASNDGSVGAIYFQDKSVPLIVSQANAINLAI